MASASRLKSSATLKVRNLRPHHSASLMKSIDQLRHFRRHAQRSWLARRQPLLADPAPVQAQGAVHTVNPLMVLVMTKWPDEL